MTHVLQNVVVPREGDHDILRLYVEHETPNTRAEDLAPKDDSLARAAAGESLSFGTYFNAFPASYWQHWTEIDEVRLTVHTRGTGSLLVYRSSEAGEHQLLQTHTVSGDLSTSVAIPLAGFDDGGWIWFDLTASTAELVLASAQWTTEAAPARQGKASLGITTFNKPSYCLDTLRTLASVPDLREYVDQVFLVDQGTDRVSEQPLFTAIAAPLSDVLRIITQPNLGGSGGFSRAMHEALQRPESDFVQLLDDDVRLEPESIRRSVVFARYTTSPVLVGGHMLDLLHPTQLHAWSEIIEETPFVWRSPDGLDMPHDLAISPLRSSPQLHRRYDADFNGWWMCLIPLAAIREVGLAFPAFIKWDDAEFCLRAGEAGYPTVTMPGVALWHVSWVGKDDFLDWQAYFHARNRLVTALLHSSAPRSGTLLRHSRRVDLKHLMAMQYYPTAARAQALRDVLSGPEHLSRGLAHALPQVRALMGEYAETTIRRDEPTAPRARGGLVHVDRSVDDMPSGWRLRWLTISTLVRLWFHRAGAADPQTPEVEFASRDAGWWRLTRYDSALIRTADQSGTKVYVRDRTRYRRMLRESASLHRALRREWPSLQERYRRVLPHIVSPQSWQKIFEEKA